MDLAAYETPNNVRMAKGLGNGMRYHKMFGFHVGIGVNVEDLCFSGNYAGFVDVVGRLKVDSTSANDILNGSGAQKIKVKALDANYQEVEHEVILNGTTEVDSGHDILRILDAEISLGTANAGTILLFIDTSDNGGSKIEVNRMRIGAGRLEAAAYTVPAGYTAYLVALNCGATRSRVHTYVRSRKKVDGKVTPFIHRVTVRHEDAFKYIPESAVKFEEKEDIILSGSSPSTTSVDMAANAELILIKN